MNNIAKIEFDKNIDSLQNLGLTHSYLSEHAKHLDSSMLLRSQYVLIISAFDTYVHKFLVNKILELYFLSQTTDIACSVEIPLDTMYKINQLSSMHQKKELLGSTLVLLFSKDSFQAPKSIEYAYGIIGHKKIWITLSNKMNMSANDIRNQLSLLVNRRNKIAHESDIDKVTGTYTSIDSGTINDCKSFICSLVEALDQSFNC